MKIFQCSLKIIKGIQIKGKEMWMEIEKGRNLKSRELAKCYSLNY